MEWVTKSVRLRPQEAAGVAELATELGFSEGALLRRWAIEGVRELRFDQALLGYTKGLLNLQQAAERAAMGAEAFEAALLRRGVFGPGYTDESPNAWLKGLSRVLQRMGRPKLAEVASDLGNQSGGPAAALAEAEAAATLEPPRKTPKT